MKQDFLRAFVLVMAFLILVAEVQRRENVQVTEFQQEQ